ncbi:MAG: glycosyltransferase, partial [Planctomycetota bacterium]
MKHERLKSTVRRLPGFESVWGAFRRWQLHGDYRRRREHYADLARERGLVYREASVIDQIRQRMVERGYSTTLRQPGQVHTFAFIPKISWHSMLYPDLYELGPVTEFDYTAHGHRLEEFGRFDDQAVRRRRQMNDLVMPALRKAHAERPVDWVFVYASGLEVRVELIRAIVEELGIPVVNMCLDDKQSWTGPLLDGQRTGQVDIASAFDVSWTSARAACGWYLCEGARPIYMPEGFDKKFYRPMAVDQDIPVSFIGGAYGFRPSVIRALERNKIPIQVFGPGWNTRSVWGNEQVMIVNRSRINLGMGGIGYSERLTNVKTRDFEIPGTGGGIYLTTFNPDLAQHFDIGREIVCYHSREEIVELIRYYLARPEEAREIARRGRQRCLAEHRWLHRYQ